MAGLFDAESDDGGLFGAAEPSDAPAPALGGAAAGLFAAESDSDGGLFGAAEPAAAVPGGGAAALFGAAEDEPAGGADEPAGDGKGGMVAALFAPTEESDDGFDLLIGGKVGGSDAGGGGGDASSSGGSESGSSETASTALAGGGAERRYKVVSSQGAIIREAEDMESEYVRTAEEGEMLEALGTAVNELGVVRVQLSEGWVSQTTADGTKLLHWMGAAEEPEPAPEPEPEPEPEVGLSTAIWDYLAPTHKAIAELEAKALADDYWQCGWCGCELEDTECTKVGPDGPDTLCATCGVRYEDEWTCGWCKCAHKDTPKVMPGPSECSEGLCLTCGTRYADEQREEEARAAKEREAAEAVARAEREEQRAAAERKRVADAKQRAEQEAAEKLRVEEAEKERQAVDAQTARRERYRVVNQAVVRLGFDIKSPTADVAGGRGSLHIGEVIEVIEERVNDQGVLRICFEDGWVSQRAKDGTVLMEKGSEWWKVVMPARIRTGWRMEAPPPPAICPQTLSVGEVFCAREIRQDDPADEDDPDADDEVEALHLRIAAGRWVSEVDLEGNFVLEKLPAAEQERYETTARRAQEEADRAEAARVREERERTEAEARAKEDAAAAAREESARKAKEEARRRRQAEADATEVGQWLRALNLGMYAVAFKDQGYEELYVLRHVLESRVDALMQEVSMAVGHSFRFRQGLSALQAEDSESAQAKLDAEREWAVNDGTQVEAAALADARAREEEANGLIARHVAARRSALDHVAEAQERADLAELRAYQDTVAAQAAQKKLSADIAKREALEARRGQEDVLRKRAEAEGALCSGRLKNAEMELRTLATAEAVAVESARELERRRVDGIARRKKDEVGRKVAAAELEGVRPRVTRAEELAEVALRVRQTATDAEEAADASLAAWKRRAQAGASALTASLEDAPEAGEALVDAETAAAERAQAAAEEEVILGQQQGLLRAASRGDEARIVQLLADGVDVNAADKEGDTALGLAAEHGFEECAALLMAHGADFTQIPTVQWTYEQVCDWFERSFAWSIKYVEQLRASHIDGEALLALDEAALRDDLGIYLGSHRRVILRKLALRRENDQLVAVRRLRAAEDEREALEAQAARQAEVRAEEEQAKLLAEREHEVKSLELAWKNTVAVAEERAETAARESASAEAEAAVLPGVKGAHLRLSVRTPSGELKRSVSTSRVSGFCPP